MMTFYLCLKRPKHTRLTFDLEKLKDPNVWETPFQAIIGGKFAPLYIMNNEETDMDSMITAFKTTTGVTRGRPGMLCLVNILRAE